MKRNMEKAMSATASMTRTDWIRRRRTKAIMAGSFQEMSVGRGMEREMPTPRAG